MLNSPESPALFVISAGSNSTGFLPVSDDLFGVSTQSGDFNHKWFYLLTLD